MKQSREYFEDLAAKLMAGHITDVELGELDAWINKRMKLTEYHFDPNFAGSEDILKRRMLTNLLSRIDAVENVEQDVFEEENEKPILRIASWFKYVAAVLVLAFAFSLYYYQSQNSSSYNDEAQYTKIHPGGNLATLTLADGTTIDLNDDQSGIIIGDQEIKYSDGSDLFVIQRNEGSLPATQANTQLLTLTTPKGGQYQVTLPDGSKVWLNAASSLSYPSHFDENQRVVELNGEAYFEVHGLKGQGGKRIPFFVKTASQEVEVLGTKFNISAYSDEPDVKTTLIEGSVKLIENNKGLDLSLSPGEQGVLAKGEIVKSEVDVNSFVSWKDGRFSFDGKTFDQVMRELGRWYNLEVIYEGSIPEKSFYGEAFRNSKFSIVMKLLKSADVDYRLEGKKLIIKNKGKEGNRV